MDERGIPGKTSTPTIRSQFPARGQTVIEHEKDTHNTEEGHTAPQRVLEHSQETRSFHKVNR